MSKDEFRHICTITSAKEAWDILEVTHEGISVLKKSKLQMLTIKCDEHRIE